MATVQSATKRLCNKFKACSLSFAIFYMSVVMSCISRRGLTVQQNKKFRRNELTFLTDLSRLASGPGKGVVTASEPRSSMMVFYRQEVWPHVMNWYATYTINVKKIKNSIPGKKEPLEWFKLQERSILTTLCASFSATQRYGFPLLTIYLTLEVYISPLLKQT